jgi:hypothetical protein
MQTLEAKGISFLSFLPALSLSISLLLFPSQPSLANYITCVAYALCEKDPSLEELHKLTEVRHQSEALIATGHCPADIA